MNAEDLYPNCPMEIRIVTPCKPMKLPKLISVAFTSMRRRSVARISILLLKAVLWLGDFYVTEAEPEEQDD